MEVISPAETTSVRRESDSLPSGDRSSASALLLLVGAIALVWSLHNAWLLPWELRSLDAPLQRPLSIVLRALVWILPALVYLRRHDPRPTLVALGVTTRLSWRGLLLGSLPAWLYLGLTSFLAQAGNESEHGPGSLLTVLMPLQLAYSLATIVLEELLLRGFLLGQLVRYTSSARAQTAVALLFTFLHLPAWIALQGVHVGLIPMTISVMLLGLVLGFVTRMSKSVLPAIALHLLNNLLADWLGGG